MSKTFALSANAEPFVPSFTEEKMKIEHRIKTLEAQLEEERLSKMRLIKSYQGEKNFKVLEKENERLNKEIREGVTKLLFERDKVKERDTLLIKKQEKVDSLESSVASLRHRIAELERDNINLSRKYEEIEDIQEKMKKEQQNTLEEKDEWTGRCLRLDFIFRKVKQIGALSEDHGSWVWDMVEDIEFPNGSDQGSIYLSLPRYLRNKYLPSENDADIQFQQDENDIIEVLSLEAQEFNQNLSEYFRRNLDENPEIIINHIRTIQSHFREHIRLNRGTNIKAAIKIQSVWRGFISRGIITYKGTLEVDNSLTRYKLILDKKVKSTHQVLPEHMRDRVIRIIFANTSKEVIHYQWLNIHHHTLEGKVGREYSIKPGEFVSIKAYFGHWFRFMAVSDEEEQFFRIMPDGFLGNLGRNIWGRRTSVFDLNTKLTITKQHYDEWSKGVIGPRAVRVLNTDNSIIRTQSGYSRFNRIINTEHLNISSPPDNIPSPPDNQPEEDIINDEEYSDDEATLQIGIQLSLETFTSLTSDMPDLNISELFQ